MTVVLAWFPAGKMRICTYAFLKTTQKIKIFMFKGRTIGGLDMMPSQFSTRRPLTL